MRSVDFASDGTSMLSASDDKTVKVIIISFFITSVTTKYVGLDCAQTEISVFAKWTQ